MCGKSTHAGLAATPSYARIYHSEKFISPVGFSRAKVSTRPSSADRDDRHSRILSESIMVCLVIGLYCVRISVCQRGMLSHTLKNTIKMPVDVKTCCTKL